MSYRQLVTTGIVLLISCGATTGEVGQQEFPEFVSIHIVTQLKEDGNLGSEINVLDFACVDGHCWMDTIVLNRCIFGTQQPISFHLTSRETVNDTLTVTLKDDVLLVEENNRIDVKAKYQFHLSKQRAPGSDITNEHVTDFLGYYVKESWLASRVILIELVRLTKPVKIELACPIEYSSR